MPPKNMDPKVLKLLTSFFEKHRLSSFEKDQKIIKPEDDKVFFLKEGVVRMFSLRKRNELTINIYRANALFPMSLVFNIKSNYTFESLTEVKGYFAPKKDFEKFIKKNPGISFDLLKRIYMGFDGFFRIFETLLTGDAYYKVLVNLIIHGRRFGQKEKGFITFDWHLTHQQLASQTGLARESVTREIKKLQDKNLIGYLGKKLFIRDLSKLEEECFSYLARKQKTSP